MKLMIKNEGEFAVKIMTFESPVGSQEDANYDNGVRETMVEPGGFANLSGDSVEHITVREFTPTAPQAPEPNVGA